MTMAEARRRRRLEATGVSLEHVGSFSFDPAVVHGNIEGFSGVAQVPLGFAGPMLVDGEHAQGEFYVPLATTRARSWPATTEGCGSPARPAASRRP